MATDTNTASVIPLHQPKTPLTPAQRARAYRLRQKAAGKPMAVVTPAVTASPLGPAYPPFEYMPGFGRVHPMDTVKRFPRDLQES
jgi:hypothetical protein